MKNRALSSIVSNGQLSRCVGRQHRGRSSMRGGTQTMLEEAQEDRVAGGEVLGPEGQGHQEIA